MKTFAEYRKTDREKYFSHLAQFIIYLGLGLWGLVGSAFGLRSLLLIFPTEMVQDTYSNLVAVACFAGAGLIFFRPMVPRVLEVPVASCVAALMFLYFVVIVYSAAFIDPFQYTSAIPFVATMAALTIARAIYTWRDKEEGA